MSNSGIARVIYLLIENFGGLSMKKGKILICVSVLVVLAVVLFVVLSTRRKKIDYYKLVDDECEFEMVNL